MMRPYEGAQHRVVGFSLGDGVAEFQSDAPDGPEKPEALIFEIASITKVFAGILLCLMVEEGAVDPKAPLREMAGELADVPEWITLEALTSHTSGLPSFYMPIWKAMVASFPEGPYAGFGRADLLDWVRRWPGKAPGQPRHAYSNLGVGLLGEALAIRAGKPFVALLTDKVLGPMGLQDTTDLLSPEQQARFMAPRNTRGKPVPAWRFEALAAAGCLRSSARDLARFSDGVIAALNAPDTALERAICRSARPIFGLGRGGAMTPRAQCSGWLSFAFDPEAPGFLFHNGGTAGSSSALYICAGRREAFGILSNNGVAAGLWSSLRMSWPDPFRQAHRYFMAG